MKVFNFLFLIFFFLKITSANAQFLFVDQENWLENEIHISEFPQDLILVKGDTIAGDTLDITYNYSSGKKAIKGQYFVAKNGKAIKTGTWDFYYPNGKIIQSKRAYNSNGALIGIIKLQSPQEDSLDIGFPHRNKNKTYYGHQFRYDINGELLKIVRYSKGFLVDEFDKDKFEHSRLKQPEIRQYKISETEVLNELSFEEALALLESDPKPIFMRITQNWNGWSKRVTKVLANNPMIAQIIAENYHLVYFDLEYKDDITFSHNGEQLIFKAPPGRRRQHELISKFFNKGIKATPTYFLVSPNLKLIATMSGASTNAAKLEHQLKYFLDGHYEFMTYKEYNPDKD